MLVFRKPTEVADFLLDIDVAFRGSICDDCVILKAEEGLAKFERLVVLKTSSLLRRRPPGLWIGDSTGDGNGDGSRAQGALLEDR